jgi:hypothetical protein
MTGGDAPSVVPERLARLGVGGGSRGWRFENMQGCWGAHEGEGVANPLPLDDGWGGSHCPITRPLIQRLLGVGRASRDVGAAAHALWR